MRKRVITTLLFWLAAAGLALAFVVRNPGHVAPALPFLLGVPLGLLVSNYVFRLSYSRLDVTVLQHVFVGMVVVYIVRVMTNAKFTSEGFAAAFAVAAVAAVVGFVFLRNRKANAAV
jgi:hypothetical protein